jgi:hypothetical protein
MVSNDLLCLPLCCTRHQRCKNRWTKGKLADHEGLKVLDNIELRVRWCLHLLCAGNSDDIRRKLPLLCTAVEQVKRKADLVVARKQAIMLEIDGLEAHFNSRKPSAKDSHSAVEFDTGER